MHKISGQIVDVVNQRMYPGTIHAEGGKIVEIIPQDIAPQRFIMPGFVDAHIHIESSMLVPSAFARLAVTHGTVATVSDPHEIANVCGMAGVQFMIDDGKTVPLKFCFGAPSCVPATGFETAGAVLDTAAVRELLAQPDIYYLAEMMNWPGVLCKDPEVMAKIEAARELGKPVDGHAPGLRGDQARSYAAAGMSTDHECFTREEALDKIAAGMKILIREGSAAKNFDALISLFETHPEMLMFCSDDKHPDDLVLGHINALVARAVALGYPLFDVLHAACVAPVQHYGLPVGLLQPGDPADFIITNNLEIFKVTETWIQGEPVFADGQVLFPKVQAGLLNNFVSYTVKPEDFEKESAGSLFPVIQAIDGELITRKEMRVLPKLGNLVQPDLKNDILKMTVVNRYQKAKPAVAFIQNFGIKNGAIASSVGHDCHNIIAVGTSDEDLARVVNLVMEAKGGIAAVHGEQEDLLPLPVAGIMTNAPGEDVGEAYERLTRIARDMGSTLKAPYMLISFMALLVIPSLKLSDKGLFDGDSFTFVDW
ncbi:Adenine deaminase [Cyclonatronum proteinivorum]|uniref:Adenine deaminase n=1 Tax=Cyclonatronum proteinivorum TaxID=1457365 RepID=A0A345UKS3_9BACT|nr:adenine deaminase [Cyclonatronum proteinivorum]AXJ01075.1 Adenine deaminase [Cyclonatronum proteinivorum]